MFSIPLSCIRYTTAICAGTVAMVVAASEPILLHERRELFTDDFIIDSMDGLERRLATPVSGGVALAFDKPWEGRFSLAGTIVKKADGYEMFYRGLGPEETVCYATSRDGAHWTRPDLGRVTRAGWKGNNVIACKPDPKAAFSLEPLGSMTVLYDDRPGVPRDERYKALRSLHPQKRGHGLAVMVSPDGFEWRLAAADGKPPPIAEGHALDTANVIAWLPGENCYAIYMRGWTGDTPGVTPQAPNELGRISPFLHGTRTIMRSVSTDLIHWTEPVKMSFGDTPLEHLYTIAAQPYFRAPQIILALPMRFNPDPAAAVLSEDQLQGAGISRNMWKGVSDAVFMTSRGGNSFDRSFLEAFVRPGLDNRNRAARSQIVALGVVPTGPAEISFYVNRAYGTAGAHVERMTLRTDGFVSLHAGRSGGSATTRPLRLDGGVFQLNYSTTPFGFVKVVILDDHGVEVPGYGESDAVRLRGDEIDGRVTWNGGRTIAGLSEKIVRLRFIASDADIYSFAVLGDGTPQ